MDLHQLESAAAAFAVLSPTHMPLHFCQIFLVVARRGQCTFQELMRELNLSNSAISRSVMAMGDSHRKGTPGFELLVTFKDPKEGRRFLVALSPKGKALYRQLQSI
jgi:DNA-binding MarR family transcriptional regulator